MTSKAKIRSWLGNDTVIGIALAILSFLVYLPTISPSLGYWDSAEIAAVLSTLGITHPTGYPLFTLIGGFVAHLPTGFRPYYNLNLMAALYCAAAVFLFYRLFLLLLSEQAARLFAFRTPAGAVPSRHSRNQLAAATGALVLAFSRTYWSEAVSLEVYSFHLVFLSLASLVFIRALGEQVDRPGKGAARWWMLFALVLGLGFSHHMMMVLLAPAFLYLYFAVHGAGRAAWIKIARAIPPFLAGLSFYLYLPLRAAQDPVMNWGNPDNLERFWLHVSAAQYRFKMFASADLPVRKLAAFLENFPAEFGYAPLLVSALGFAWLCRHSGRLVIFSLLLIVTCLFYAVNYDFDDPNFYLHVYVVTALWLALGARWLLARAGEGSWRWGARLLCGVLVLFPFDVNYAAVDESRNHAVEDYVRNVLDPLEPGALILTDDLQGLVPGAYYLQLVEGVRPDVVVVGHGVLAYPWYLRQLEKRYPGLLAGLGPEIEAYEREREKVERGDTANFRVYSARFTSLVQALLRANAGVRPLYVTPDIAPGFFRRFRPVPSGLAVRLLPEGIPPEAEIAPLREFDFRPIPAALSYGPMIRAYYAKGYYNQGAYATLQGNAEAGAAMFAKALEVNPDFAPARQALLRLRRPNP